MGAESIRVLDHGFVRLVEFMGSDLSIVRAARVSYDAAWRAGEDQGSDHRLIRYLWKHRHTSPFEAVTLTFEVKAPIFVFRQWHRHRTWSFNELSARYRELPAEFYLPDPKTIGIPDPKNRQGRIQIDEEPDEATHQQIGFYSRSCERAFSDYRSLLDAGWPRELARAVLPLAAFSHMFATVNLLNLFRFMTLRSEEHAQFEIRQYANAMKELAKTVAPVAVAAWEENP
jgi:thymidylate synthase (FAD)